MTVADLRELFEKHHEEYLRFERITIKRCNRPDLHAFLLLEELVPGDTDIVSDARHDEIFLGVEVKDLARIVTEAQVVELLRCGVSWEPKYDCLYMLT